MKFKLLGVSTQNEVNVGDYVQALAASQFLPSIDGFVQREHLNSATIEDSKMIMNGWYMHHPENWPPSNSINPLFVSFHMNVLARKTLLGERSIDYLKKNSPIGCRDLETVQVLQEKGVNAYFSGCLTLTLGKKYKSADVEDTCYFVDPYFETDWNLASVVKNAIYLLYHWKDISIISKKHPEAKTGLRKKMIITTFYREYTKIFSKELLLNAIYINQQSRFLKKNDSTEFDYLSEAEDLVKKYAKAKLVVTSRIHCALPCLGLETPVIYIEDMNQTEASKCRLDGLRDLFTIIDWNRDHLVPRFDVEGKISKSNFPNNKTKWKKLANDLIDRCQEFIK